MEHKSFFKTKTKKKKSKGSQKELFMEVWNERVRQCEICGKVIIEPQAFCFAHRAPKGTYPEHKFRKENISLVCSIKCHLEVDKIYKGIKRQELVDFLNKSV